MVRVVPIEDVIEAMPEHKMPYACDMRAAKRVLQKQGQIVPIVLDEWRAIDIALVYAAVELDWPTMIVTDTDITSG